MVPVLTDSIKLPQCRQCAAMRKPMDSKSAAMMDHSPATAESLVAPNCGSAKTAKLLLGKTT